MKANIAFRIQHHAEPGDILLSKATWQPVDYDMTCTERGVVECMGLHYPITVYAPTGLPTNCPGSGRG